MHLLKQKQSKKLAIYAFLAIFIVLLLTPLAQAADDIIARSYKTQGTLIKGSLVSFAPNSTTNVEASNQDNAQSLVGVVVQPDSSLVAVVQPQDQAEVAISGTVPTLVSTINGDIKKGDKISVSPISGVGQKASGGVKIVGVANQDFSSVAKQDIQTKKVTDKAGNIKDVYITTLNLAVSVGDDPATAQSDKDKADSNQSGIASAIKNLANDVAGHSVSTTQIVLSFFVALIAVVAIAVLVYGTIKNGIQATGRNPLAKPAIFEAVAQVMLMVVIISLVTVIGIYLILQ